LGSKALVELAVAGHGRSAPPRTSGLTATARADTSGGPGYETLAIPIPFYNESFGFAAGCVYGQAGWPEPQSRVLGTVMAGTRGSGMLVLVGQDLRTPWRDRLFIDPCALVGLTSNRSALGELRCVE
jgi:hypothetical protein